MYLILKIILTMVISQVSRLTEGLQKLSRQCEYLFVESLYFKNSNDI